MIITHLGHEPRIDPDAWIAPNACICGDVEIGPGSRIAHGAQIIAEGSAIRIGANTIVMQNAVVRSTEKHAVHIGDNCLIGPLTHLVGCTLRNSVFVATHSTIFHEAVLGERSEVRIGGIVHIKTTLPDDAVVPIGWVAVGNPASILPPGEHEHIWAVQEPLHFLQTVYGVQEHDMPEITVRLSGRYGKHRDDALSV